MEKPKCIKCKTNSCLVNYKRKGKTYYRKFCFQCSSEKNKRKELEKSLLEKSGYKKKNICDRCGFNCRHPSQMRIVYLDGDKLNVSRSNLRTHCANCIIELANNPLSKKNDLVPDY